MIVRIKLHSYYLPNVKKLAYMTIPIKIILFFISLKNGYLERNAREASNQ